MQGPRVQFLVGELRSCMPSGMARKKSAMVNNVVKQQKTLQKSKLMQRTNLWLPSGTRCGGRINEGFGISKLFLLLFSHSVVSHSLQFHGLQHTRLPCPSLSPRVHSNSCLLSQWCYLTISSSATFFFFSFAFSLSQQQGLFQWAFHIRWPKY